MSRINAQAAAKLLGVSARQVYDLAAPNGPLPCYRIGSRIVFDPSDIETYLLSCRCTEIKKAVVTSLNSTPVLRATESELESVFRARGLKPRRKPLGGKKASASTRRSDSDNVTPIR